MRGRGGISVGIAALEEGEERGSLLKRPFFGNSINCPTNGFLTNMLQNWDVISDMHNTPLQEPTNRYLDQRVLSLGLILVASVLLYCSGPLLGLTRHCSS